MMLEADRSAFQAAWNLLDWIGESSPLWLNRISVVRYRERTN